MNVDVSGIIDAIQSFDIQSAAAALEESGHILSQAETAVLAALTLAGILFCLFGLKIVRFWAALAGFALGFAGGAAAAFALNQSDVIILAAGVITGIILAVLGAVIYKLGVFIIVFLSAGGFCIRILYPQDLVMLGICLAVGFIAALISLRFAEVLTIFVTSLAGALLCGTSAYYLIPYRNEMIRTGICIAAAVLGIIVQLLFESKKRKQRNLKKAAEIRESNSTENEVERARAMFDEAVEEQDDDIETGNDSDGQTGKNPAADGELEEISLDDIEDDLDDEPEDDLDEELEDDLDEELDDDPDEELEDESEKEKIE